jgi:lipopolysaccharide export system permease protein
VVIKRKAAVNTSDPTAPRVEYDYIARAREARLEVNLETRTIRVDADRWVIAGPSGYVESYSPRPEEIPLGEEFSEKNIKAKAVSLEWDELAGRAAELAGQRGDLLAKRDEALRRAEGATDPTFRDLLGKQAEAYAAQAKEAGRQVRNVEYEFHIRPALAVGCLCFALIGCPVGIYANRADYLSTFVTCFLPAVFVYYPLLLCGGNLARDGKVPMAVGVWAADALVGLAAVVLSFRLIRR